MKNLAKCENGKHHVWRNKLIEYNSKVCLVCGRTKAEIRKLKENQKLAKSFIANIEGMEVS